VSGAAERWVNVMSVVLTILRVVAIIALTAITLIGFLYLTRGSALKHVRSVGQNEDPLAPNEPEFPLSVAMATGAILLPGNRVDVAVNGDGTFARLWDDLRSARRSIIFQVYYGLAGGVADTLGEILLERANAGVRVLALYDAFGTGKIPTKHLTSLRNAGATIVAFRPIRLSALNVVDNRSHVRAIVIDGRIGWTGGFGIDDKWLGDGVSNGGWRDTNVRFEGPVVRQLEAAFAAAWSEATGELLTGRLTLPTVDAGSTTAALLYAPPTLGTTIAERFLALSISAARKTFYVTNAYFAPATNFIDLLTAAARRGVDVRLLLPGPRTDVRIARRAGRKRYERLFDAGVRVYEWQPTALHAKTFVVDGLWSSVGTMNFDNRSLVLNEEVTLTVLDAAFGERMNTMFLDDLNHATEIIPDEFRKRRWTERVVEWGANIASRVL